MVGMAQLGLALGCCFLEPCPWSAVERDSWRGSWLGNSAVIDALTVQLEKQSATAWQGVSELLTQLRKGGDKLKALDLSNKSVPG